MRLQNEMLKQAELAYPNEACGVVIQVGKKQKLIPCRNISKEPTVTFTIDPDDYAAAEELGEIVAIYHSHPNNSAAPSSADLTMCETLGLPWHIVSWPQAGYRYIEPSGYKAPLEGRAFVYGVHDCSTLMRDYYAEKFGVAMSIPASEHGWWLTGQNLYMDNLENVGLVIVSDLQPDDLILMSFDSQVPHHAAIYLGDDIILHHLEGYPSMKTFYGEFYRKATACIARLKSLC